MDRFVILSGCSGGGKSALAAELARRGHTVVDEPGRRIVRAELAVGGTALPWQDAAEFARRTFDLALADVRDAEAEAGEGFVFFDRSLVDAASFLELMTGEPVLAELAAAHRYNDTVFFTPPWPELFAEDGERRHDFAAAVAECERLRHAYPSIGYTLVDLPLASVEERADMVLARLRPL